jgi:hypothetical protein
MNAHTCGGDSNVEGVLWEYYRLDCFIWHNQLHHYFTNG